MPPSSGRRSGLAQQLEAAGERRQAGISVGEKGRAQLLQRLGAAALPRTCSSRKSLTVRR